jgi:hypothetical protein
MIKKGILRWDYIGLFVWALSIITELLIKGSWDQKVVGDNIDKSKKMEWCQEGAMSQGI